MVPFIITLFLAYYSIRILHRILGQRASGAEFGVTRSRLALAVSATGLVWIPILSPLVPGLVPRPLLWPVPLVVLFFVPHLLAYPPLIRKLETSGTSRVEALESALRDARTLGYCALLYFLLSWGVSVFMMYQANT